MTKGVFTSVQKASFLKAERRSFQELQPTDRGDRLGQANVKLGIAEAAAMFGSAGAVAEAYVAGDVEEHGLQHAVVEGTVDNVQWQRAQLTMCVLLFAVFLSALFFGCCPSLPPALWEGGASKMSAGASCHIPQAFLGLLWGQARARPG